MAKMERAYTGVDNISRLPDEILLHILSLLHFKDAVRSSVLSTRWRYLYASISDLILYFSLSGPKEIDVVNVVDRVFFYRNNRCPINRFQLTCSESNEPNSSHLEQWIRAIMWHGVRELDLSTFSNLLLPASLFTYRTLVVLKLDVSLPYGMEVPVKVCLPSLKVLHLDNVFSFLGDDSANRLLSNCPVLEHLKYKNENDKENCKVIVSHPTLKSLDIDCMTCMGWSGNLKILIDAPSLVDLKYCVCDVNSHTFVNVECLTEADIYCQHNEGVGDHRDYILAATDLMRGITNVQRLTISGGTLVDLVKFNIPIPVLPNVTYLEILWCRCFGLAELPHLLARCESLETLLLEDLPDEEWNLDAWYNLDEFRCLKKIEIGSFSGTDNQMELVKYFLKSAKVLESMTICIWNAEYEEQLEITKELLLLPRVSKICSVAFEYGGKLG